MSNIPEIFSAFQGYLDNEHSVREVIRTHTREIEATAREILITLQCIHQANGAKEIPAACERSRKKLEDVRQQYEQLKGAVPEDQYYRFHDHWRFVTQRLSFLVALIQYLDTGEFISHAEVAAELGLACRRTDGFHLDLEDYLIGQLDLASELARFCVNAVTFGDYARPLHISKFLGELSAGFRMLNFKNDSLRKRFDGLKYNIKKVEEVVYDLSIRGLKPSGEPSSGDPSELEPKVSPSEGVGEGGGGPTNSAD
ncbi:hypothetical protein R5R35_005046 [Gryllus longicercus]|uniref:Translin n=1 Tax=Gryllus longicercus TaxID=2509291 RepID=A0AAN9ZA03_9ORTH